MLDKNPLSNVSVGFEGGGLGSNLEKTLGAQLQLLPEESAWKGCTVVETVLGRL